MEEPGTRPDHPCRARRELRSGLGLQASRDGSGLRRCAPGGFEVAHQLRSGRRRRKQVVIVVGSALGMPMTVDQVLCQLDRDVAVPVLPGLEAGVVLEGMSARPRQLRSQREDGEERGGGDCRP